MVFLEEDNLFNSTSFWIVTEAVPRPLYKSSPVSSFPYSLEERIPVNQLTYLLQTSSRVIVDQVIVLSLNFYSSNPQMTNSKWGSCSSSIL